MLAASLMDACLALTNDGLLRRGRLVLGAAREWGLPVAAAS